MYFRALARFVVAEIRYRYGLFVNRKLIDTMKMLTRADPFLTFEVRQSLEHPTKLTWTTHYAR